MNLIKKIMAKLAMRKFVPNGEDIQQGATPMDKLEILEALAKYKAQNPTKYEAKKAALFARYNLVDEEVSTQEPDANDIELEALKAKAKAKK